MLRVPFRWLTRICCQVSPISAVLLQALVILSSWPASSSTVQMAPDPLIATAAWEDGALDTSLELVDASAQTGQVSFELDISYSGVSDPTLIPSANVEFDFGSTRVDPFPSLQFLVGSVGSAVFANPCFPEPKCNLVAFSVSDPSVVVVTVDSGPDNLPGSFTIAVTRGIGVAPPLVAVGGAQLSLVPEPAALTLVFIGLSFIGATARRREASRVGRLTWRCS